MKIKICGMKYQDNIKQVAALQPDYLGFIFYKRSKRNFDGVIPDISDRIIKTGVFVDESIDFILNKVQKYSLKAIQLHGDESPELCKQLKEKKDLEVIKVFSVGEKFNFDVLKPYEAVSDYFLFDTKGKEKGGNGIAFNWKLLKGYSSKKSFFLSGGIGLEELNSIKDFFKTKASNYCFALDLNSKFEIEPGFKDIEKLKIFIQNLKPNN
ncbi:MAG: phosphoribosylanthranilate isomerase [Bacteroidetes bacterium]|nr:MAG: phosphoribosylanthranilate isomerase [Bacteroidota bacterium]